MQFRILAGSAALSLVVLAGTVTPGISAAPTLKWALVNLTEPTSIAGQFVTGPVMFLHDDAKMARGEPCTGVYRFVPGKGPGEEIVAFHCKPRWTKAPREFTAAIAHSPYGPRTLTEYQFAGDEEAHGVPLKPH